MKSKSNKGFSLVELLVVITIIAILSVVAYMSLGGQTAKARNSVRTQDLSNIQSALEIYFINNSNTYPTTLSVLKTAGLITELPKDPTKKTLDYAYTSNAGTKTYQLGATLEDETGGAAYKAYIIGNSATDLIAGIATPTGTCPAGTEASNKSTDCVPLNIWTP